MFVAILKELDIITEDAAKALSKELSTKILPSNPEDALKQVAAAVETVRKSLDGDVKVEPWLVHIQELEARVRQLESKKK